MAIINGGFYRKGDTIEGFVIKDIQPDRVVLERGGKDFTLRIAGFSAAGPTSEAGL
jgi:type II secretory pathway component PulC